jgi:hypothetical protein
MWILLFIQLILQQNPPDNRHGDVTVIHKSTQDPYIHTSKQECEMAKIAIMKQNSIENLSGICLEIKQK